MLKINLSTLQPSSSCVSKPHRILFILTILISLTCVHSSTPTQTVNKLMLTQVQQSKYALKTQIANLNVNIMAHLSDEQDWVKQDGCVVCQVQNNQDKQQNCKNTCFAESQYGIKCSKSYCKKLTTQQQKSLTYNIKQGTRVRLTIKQLTTKQKLTYPTILASKMSHKYAQMGRINLLNGNKGLFGDQVLIVKNHDKDISVYYYGRATATQDTQQTQQNNNKEKNKNKQNNKRQSLLKDVKVVMDSKADDVSDIVGLVLSNSNDAQLQQQVAQNKKQNEQEDDEEQEQQQQQINVFQISQIKLRQLYKNQQPPVKKTKKQKKNKKSQQDQQNVIPNLSPYTSQVPLIKTSAQFSIKTDKLLLPPLVFKKFTKLLIDKYFSPSQSSQSKPPCEFDNNYLKCTDKSNINLQKIDNVTLTLTVNGIQLQFPLRVIIQSCKQKSCSFLIGVSKNKKSVIIGDFILNVFAMKYQKKMNRFILYRLNNQWAQNFKQFRQYSEHQVNFIWMMLTLVFKALWWVFKILFFFACLSLGINCLYHWREVFNWFMDIFSKLSNKESRQILRQNNVRNIGKLKKGINKMKIRIKDRIKTALHKDNPHQQLATHIDFEGEQFDYDDHQHNKQTVKLMRVDQLSDKDSSHDQQSDHQQQKQTNIHKKPSNNKPINSKDSKTEQKKNIQTSFTTIQSNKPIIEKQQNPISKKPSINQAKQNTEKQKNKQPDQIKQGTPPQQEHFYEFNHNQNQFNDF